MSTRLALRLLFFLMCLAIGGNLFAQSPPRVLIVVAHPDDDAMFAGTVYKITHELGGIVDLALLTDGSGGYRYSTLAESIYGLELTNEQVARQYMPAIRKKELMEGGTLVGIRKYFFMDQFDHGYTQDVDTVLAHVWEADFAEDRIRRILDREDYDFVFCHLPVPEMHGHHKAATILALRAAAGLEADKRPVVLGAMPSGGGRPVVTFEQLAGYPITRVAPAEPVGSFDLMKPIGFEGRLNYRIVVNWLIAAHKTQGTMQLLMNGSEKEHYWVFAENPVGAEARVRRLFEDAGADGR